MGVKRGEPWLDLLHREAEGDLTPAEQAQLAMLAKNPEVTETRGRLAQVTATLVALPAPPLPKSLASATAADIAWSARVGQAPLPPAPRSVAREVAGEVQAARWLGAPPPLPRSLAPAVASEVVWEGRLAWPSPPPPRAVAGPLAARIAREAEQTLPPPPQPAHHPAPLLLVSGLLVSLTLLGLTSAWPNLAAGALVLRALVAQVSPVAGAGLLLLLLTSLLVAWRPTPAVQRFGAAAFALSAVLSLPPLYQAFGRSGVSVGRDVTIHGRVAGNVIALGGDVLLAHDAYVQGEVVTLFGDVRREAGASVAGRVNTLLGRASGDATALQTAPPSGLNLATASAFRPLLGWLGGAAWSLIFGLLTGGMMLLLFVAGAAPVLAGRQRQAPLRTLALGVLALTVLIGPALGLALAGLLVPALLASAFALLLIATGLSVSAYDVGRTAAGHLRLPAPDVLGALLGLIGVAASLAVPPLALSAALVGGAWGTGTLLLTRSGREEQTRNREQAAKRRAET
ncbi:hypothetical protein [Deinococcus sp. YIM 77859]|uniref:hypothetical protein n=1 Tax=Deinococcus sp. YIM 77859 TaxID=1540221 RepID=UPI00068DD6E8|nr:hypothetical protein [Deinococcus sp. YIM 77859]